MHRTSTAETIELATHNGVPPLEGGDHLSRDEFERRYLAMPEDCKAELINGVVYMSSPLRYRSHGMPSQYLNGWLFLYLAHTPGVEGAENATVRLDVGSEPQPDGLLLITPECGGQTRIDDDDYVAGAPELALEAAASSVSYDLHEKLRAYQRAGVQEYLVWRVLDREVDWFILRNNDYVRSEPDEQRILRSTVFPGLWLDVAALVRFDSPRVLEVLRQGIATPEHAEFVVRLKREKASKSP